MSHARPGADPTIETTKTLFEGWGRYLLVTVSMPDGTSIKREVEDHGDATAVLAFDPERKTAMLVRQLRAPMLVAGGQGYTLELMAGLIDPGEELEASARREALEETGLMLGALEPVVQLQPMPGISTERIHLFLAEYREGDRKGQGGGLSSESESIAVVEMPLAELAAMADRGALPDAKTLVLVQTLRLRRPELFADA